jgi:hypothetical protein
MTTGGGRGRRYFVFVFGWLLGKRGADRKQKGGRDLAGKSKKIHWRCFYIIKGKQEKYAKKEYREGREQG